MAYQSIGRGTSANDGTGDDLRTGAGKVNANFVELYTYLGTGSALSADPVVTLAGTQTLTNKTLTAPTITGAGAIAGVFTGNITGNVTGNADTATALATARTIAGQSFDGTANITIASSDLSDAASVVTETSTDTLTNKTLTAPSINGVVGGTTTSMTITALTTEGISNATGQLEITAANQVVEIQGGGANSGAITLNCETNAHGQKIIAQPHSAAVTNTLTLPAGGNQELVGTDATQTLTNKTLTAPTITGAGAIAGVFTGNITGDVTGNVTGNVDGIVGGTTPAAGSFTTASTSVHFQAAVHADTTARDAAITSPAAGMVAYLTATNKLQVYTGSAWETITSA
jgi:hypothetical protein